MVEETDDIHTTLETEPETKVMDVTDKDEATDCIPNSFTGSIYDKKPAAGEADGEAGQAVA